MKLTTYCWIYPSFLLLCPKSSYWRVTWKSVWNSDSDYCDSPSCIVIIVLRKPVVLYLARNALIKAVSVHMGIFHQGRMDRSCHTKKKHRLLSIKTGWPTPKKEFYWNTAHPFNSLYLAQLLKPMLWCTLLLFIKENKHTW